jgi:hypothetical protein
MQCKEVEGVLEQDLIAPLPEEARAHVASCTACQNLVSDFNALIAAAERLPAEIEPPERVWISLRAQLEAEGIIKEQPVFVARETAPWWQSFGALLRGRSLATAGVGLLIAAAALFQIQSGKREPIANNTPVAAERSTVTPSSSLIPASDPFSNTAAAISEQEHDLANMQRASTSASRSSASPVDASLQKSLRDLDEFIAECSRHLKEQPQDELAREYLAAAYQQKAELLSAMIDRGRSVN